MIGIRPVIVSFKDPFYPTDKGCGCCVFWNDVEVGDRRDGECHLMEDCVSIATNEDDYCVRFESSSRLRYAFRNTRGENAMTKAEVFVKIIPLANGFELELRNRVTDALIQSILVAKGDRSQEYFMCKELLALLATGTKT